MEDAQETGSADELRLGAKFASLAAGGVKVDPDRPFVLELGTPIEFGKETLTEFVFQPMKAKHIRPVPAEGIKMGDLLNLAGKLVGHPPRVMDELTAADLARVNEVVAVFMEPFQGTG